MRIHFIACYDISSTITRLDTRIVYDSIDEMSEQSKKNLITAQMVNNGGCYTYKHISSFDYSVLFGDLIATDDAFAQFKNLFGDVGDFALTTLECQLKDAKEKCIKYMSHQEFTKVFFDRFTNSERMMLNQRQCEIINNRYIPARIDRDENNIYYCYESSTITDIVFSTIHFALANKYKLIQCKHCERWFLTPTLKETFCKRTSPCFGMIVNGKKVLGQAQPCKIAVDTIKKRLQHRHRVIYNKFANESFDCGSNCENCPHSECIIDDEHCKIFCDNYKKMKKNIINSPTVKNIVQLHSYLYADDMPKQERPNRRKSNAEKRKLMGL